MGKKKNPFGRYSERQFRKNLELLESIYGSQKKAAEKFGVTTSTYRNWKSGKTTPEKSAIGKINRSVAQNRKKLKQEPVRKKVEKKATKRKEQAAKRKPGITKESLQAWMDRRKLPAFIRNNLPILTQAEYVAYPKGDPRVVQFMTGTQLLEQRFGRPKGKMAVKIYGLFTRKYDGVESLEEPNEMGQMTLFDQDCPTMVELDQEWDLAKTLDYTETKFFGQALQKGKFKFNPRIFLGYRL